MARNVQPAYGGSILPRRSNEREVTFIEPRRGNLLSTMAKEEFDEDRLQALIKMEVACRLALESLPKLPRETGDALREPVDQLCKISEREIERLRPGLNDRTSPSS